MASENPSPPYILMVDRTWEFRMKTYPPFTPWCIGLGKFEKTYFQLLIMGEVGLGHLPQESLTLSHLMVDGTWESRTKIQSSFLPMVD
jgi:hypothetical protein